VLFELISGDWQLIDVDENPLAISSPGRSLSARSASGCVDDRRRRSLRAATTPVSTPAEATPVEPRAMQSHTAPETTTY
jgi:hypothetical protein